MYVCMYVCRPMYVCIPMYYSITFLCRLLKTWDKRESEITTTNPRAVIMSDGKSCHKEAAGEKPADKKLKPCCACPDTKKVRDQW